MIVGGGLEGQKVVEDETELDIWQPEESLVGGLSLFACLLAWLGVGSSGRRGLKFSHDEGTLEAHVFVNLHSPNLWSSSLQSSQADGNEGSDCFHIGDVPTGSIGN